MSRLAKVACVAVLGLAAAACTTVDRQSARGDARTLLARTPTEPAQHAYFVTSLTNMRYGDRWVGTNVVERAQTAHDSVGARFTLATGYQATGRLQDAAAIYRTLLADGQYKWIVTGASAAVPARKFNVAEESAARLADIDRRMLYAASSSQSGGAFAATEAGTPVAAIVGGRAPNGRVSDAEAFRRDNLTATPTF